MRKIKLKSCLLFLLILLLPINNIFADSYTLNSYTDSNEEDFYLPSFISIDTSNAEVISEEEITEDYLTDYNDITWNLYTVTLEVLNDGTDNAFEALKKELDGNAEISYSSFSCLSDNSYTIDGIRYTPYVDYLAITAGEEINIKILDDETYEKNEQYDWPVYIQCSYNRYNSQEDLNACIDSEDSNESSMRKGTIQVNLLYPNTMTIESYFDSIGFSNTKVVDNSSTANTQSSSDSLNLPSIQVNLYLINVFVLIAVLVIVFIIIAFIRRKHVSSKDKKQKNKIIDEKIEKNEEKEIKEQEEISPVSKEIEKNPLMQEPATPAVQEEKEKVIEQPVLVPKESEVKIEPVKKVVPLQKPIKKAEYKKRTYIPYSHQKMNNPEYEKLIKDSDEMMEKVYKELEDLDKEIKY